MSTDVTLPALGESVTEGTVTRWLKNVGDAVAVDEPLLEVSTDKVDTEIPSPVAGTLLEIVVPEDEVATVGAVLARVGAEGEALASGADAGAPAPAAAPEPVAEPAAKPPVADTQAAERKRLERARAVDELVESLAPKLQVRFDPKVAWLDHSVSFAFSLTNAGRRAIRVAQPRIALKLHPLPNMRPSALALKSGDVQVEVCPAGLIGPGETLNCSGVLRAEASFTGVGHISFQALISARTDVPAKGDDWKTIRATYKGADLESRMGKDVPVSGDLWR